MSHTQSHGKGKRDITTLTMAGTTNTTTKTPAIATMLVLAAIALSSFPVISMAQGPTLAPEPSSFTPGPSSYAPAPGPDCFTSLVNMSDCLTFVEAGSNLTKPEKKCCPEFAGLVESAPICLCQLLANPAQAGVPIDLNKALTLPSVCKISTPPASLCAAIGVPVSLPPGSSPAAVPTASTPRGSEPTGSRGTLSPEGLPSSPASGSENSNTNAGRSIAASRTCFLAGLATLLSISLF